MTRDEAVMMADALLRLLPPGTEWIITESGGSFDVGSLTRVCLEPCADAAAETRLLVFLARSREIVEALIAAEPSPCDWFVQPHPEAQEHPVDAEIRVRLARSARSRALDERLARLERLVGEAIGPAFEQWLELEETWNERSAAREIAYYNLGIEDGRADRAVVEITGTETHDSLASAYRKIGRLADAISALAARSLKRVDGSDEDQR